MIQPFTVFIIYCYLVFGCLTSRFVAARSWEDVKEVADEIKSIKCQDGLSINFTNAYITRIGENFIDSPTVKCVDIANNHIEHVEEGAFDTLPSLIYLNLSGNNLDADSKLLSLGGYKSLKILFLDYASTRQATELILYELYPELRYLSLRGNAIYDIHYFNKTNSYAYKEPIVNALPKITYMDLSENSLPEIVFSSCETLKYLYLQQNELHYFRTALLSNLLVLNVDDNRISQITYSSDGLNAGGSKKLQHLSVANNEVYVIDSQAFLDTTELISLNLSNNRLEYIDPTTFEPLRSLKHLILDGNLLENIPNITIATNIRFLSLYKNRITSIPNRMFVRVEFLEKLNLAENRIKGISTGAFDGLQRLEYLNLQKNKLTSLPKNWCASLTSLRVLDLSSNLFTSLESLSLMDVMPLQQLNLYNHQLKYIHVPLDQNFPKNMTVNLS